MLRLCFVKNLSKISDCLCLPLFSLLKIPFFPIFDEILFIFYSKVVIYLIFTLHLKAFLLYNGHVWNKRKFCRIFGIFCRIP